MADACRIAELDASLAAVRWKRSEGREGVFAGLDMSVDETTICVVGDSGKAVLGTAVPTDPELIGEALKRYAGQLSRVGHETRTISLWLHAGMLAQGLLAVLLEMRHVRAALYAQRNTTEADDASPMVAGQRFYSSS